MALQQLSTGDAVFLSIETGDLPAHIGGLSILEAPPEREFSYADFLDFVRERVGGCARFGWRLQAVPFGLDRPYWCEMPDFDPADHVDRVALPAPYSPESLSRIAGLIFERPLDKSRPLWELTLIEGLPGGRVGLLWKMHHCMIDGAAGASLIEQLFDFEPGAARQGPNDVREEARAGAPVSPRSMAARAVRNALELPRVQRKYLGKAIANVLPTGFPGRSGSRARVGAALDLRPSARPPADAIAPPTLFNGVVGPHRAVAWASVPLDDVKRVKNALSVTVNDVLLAITGGAVRRFLLERDGLPTQSLVASVPSSTRPSGDRSLGNQLSDLTIRWSTDRADPVERLLAIHEDALAAKARQQSGESISVMQVLGEAFLPGVVSAVFQGLAGVSDRLPLPSNVVVSNVPMSPVPLYCAGARMIQMIPISMLAPTQGLNITVTSYCGELHFGLVYDPDLMRDGWELAGLIPKDLQELQKALDRALELDSDGPSAA